MCIYTVNYLSTFARKKNSGLEAFYSKASLVVALPTSACLTAFDIAALTMFPFSGLDLEISQF